MLRGSIAGALLSRRLLCSSARALEALSKRALRKVSSNPLVFVIDDFVDADMLARLQHDRRATEEDGKRAMQQMLEDIDPNSRASPERLAFMTLISEELFNGQWGAKDNIRLAASSSSDSNNDGSTHVSYPEGLHVDTNNDAKFRSATCILYLNDVAPECGGATIFPLADATEADLGLCASRALLGEQITHTRQTVSTPVEGSVASPSSFANSGLLEGRIDDSVLRIQPCAGRLMIFFSRTDDGDIDSRSWHGGERLRDASQPAMATEKHIMTLFKEVHYKDHMLPWPYGCGDQSFESYIAPQIAQQRRHIEALAEAQL
eukprot:5125419-Prymnesium_polylepis.2